MPARDTATTIAATSAATTSGASTSAASASVECVCEATMSAESMSAAIPSAAPLSKKNSGLYTYLLGFRVEKGQDHTHTSFVRPSGAFYLPAAEHDRFHALYKSALALKEDLHLTEHHRHVGPVVVDLDFRFEPQAADLTEVAAGRAPRRRHTESVVREIARIYGHHISEFSDTPPMFDVYVTEKPGATMHKALIKDGLHLLVPGVVTRPAVQLLLRQEVLAPLAVALAPLGLANRIDDVVDEQVIERNNWMMYGSRKPLGEPYRVTRCYTYCVATDSVVETPLPAPGRDADDAYVDLLSIRNKYNETPVRPDRAEAVAEFVTEQDERRKKRDAVRAFVSASPNARQNTVGDDAELDHVRQLATILSPERACSYEKWMRVGWCLRNTDHRLLDAWVAFSRQAADKYVDGECERLWQLMKPGTLTVRSLHLWAKHDDPEAYERIRSSNRAPLIEQAARSGAHNDTARVVHHMYGMNFVCASVRNRSWWEFRDHRWRESDSAITLRRELSNTVWREFMKAIHRESARAVNSPAEDQDRIQDAIKKLNVLATKLRTTKYKDDVIKECAELFYVERFDDLLDANCDLLGFENGVYDLYANEFRDGRPEDHVSFSTGLNYTQYDEHSPAAQDILRFWEQVHPNKLVRDYVIRSLSTCLSGHIKTERFNIWTGSGSNAKSITVNLLEKTLGEYCVKFPVTLLTMKRAASNAATSEIARAKGKRFAVLQEPGDDERLNIGLMKELTGGDKIFARPLYREPIEFKPQFKMFLLCNHLPNVPSEDGGTWRRIRVVEFGSRFVDKPDPERPNEFPIDSELPQRLDGWKEQFLAMLIDVHHRTSHQRYDEPEAVMQCTRDYQRNNDFLADFIDTCLERGGPDAALTMDDLIAEFKDWHKNESIPIRMPKRRDIQLYMDRALQRNAQGGGRLVVYRGFRVRDRYGSGAATNSEDPLDV